MRRKYKKYTFCFDIDNTICTTYGSEYSSSKPKKKKIKFINNLYNQGHHIIFFTARGMGSLRSVTKAKKKYYNFTKKQLLNWGAKYNKLILGKPSWDYFIDDKNLDYNENWEKSISKIID